jgi:hypothetical protein
MLNTLILHLLYFINMDMAAIDQFVFKKVFEHHKVVLIRDEPSITEIDSIQYELLDDYDDLEEASKIEILKNISQIKLVRKSKLMKKQKDKIIDALKFAEADEKYYYTGSREYTCNNIRFSKRYIKKTNKYSYSFYFITFFNDENLIKSKSVGITMSIDANDPFKEPYDIFSMTH